ncbi:MAG: hypothetical protein KatS3mg099_066 [Candidatus Parcubacteria bacterium]|nr:MAG: hypothetical protein KatS3mg099_066 [Candidatus Parcubacteria bacterium]
MPRDPLGDTVNHFYIYYAASVNDYTTYGIAAKMESDWGKQLAQQDGGAFSEWYELGQDPSYCQQKYGGATQLTSPTQQGGNNWMWRGSYGGSWGDRCQGGN